MSEPQNIYDEPDFLAGYSTLPRSIDGLDGAPEWPSLQRMLPVIAGTRVLDLGCGFGWFCRWAVTEGASAVVGLDVSEAMLHRAEADTPSGAVEYRQQNLDALEDLGATLGRFDLVYSSLTLHYLTDLHRLCRTVHDLLVPGGAFVFSVEHPIFSAPSNPGFAENAEGRRTWPLDRYLDEGERETNWFVPGVVKHHRTIGTHVRALVAAGLRIVSLEEWGPTNQQLAEHPEWQGERDRPPFLLIRADRAG